MAIGILRRNRKAQSAMEYLMTYGWAILIIAVVLGALFSLGVFSGASLIGNACIAGPGYYCGTMVYTHAGTLTASIGQSTGSNWGSAIIIFAVQGSATGTGGGPVVLTGNTITFASGIASGQQVAFSVTAQVPLRGNGTGGKHMVLLSVSSGSDILP